MAAPNIVNVATITGRTTAVAVTTSNVVLVANAAASGMVLKVNSLIVSNIDGANACDVTLSYNTSSGGAGTSFRLANTISVPADASLVVIGKDNQIYLEENKSLVVVGSVASDLEAVVSYEEIS